MATDYYSLGYGMDPTPEERQRAIADALRKRELGNLGIMSGDSVLSPLGRSFLKEADTSDSSMLKAGENRLLRQTEATRNQALAQYHQDRLAQDAAEEARRAKGTINPKETDDGTLLGVNNVTGETTELHKSDKKLGARLLGGRGGGGAPQAPATVETAQPWEIAMATDHGKIGPGALVPLGRDLAAKKRILTLSAIINGTGGVAGSAAQFHADKASLAEGQKQADVTDVSEGKALADIDILVKQAKPLMDSGSPFLNAPLRKLQEHSGDPQVAAYLTARVAASAQINKVINSGTLTESARKEADELLNSDATLPQLMAKLEVLKQDMARSRDAMHQRVTDVHGRMSGKPAAAAPHGSASASRTVVRKQINRQMGKTRLTYSDGTTEDVDGVQ